MPDSRRGGRLATGNRSVLAGGFHEHDLAQQLNTALESRAVIDQAKGIIMGARGVTADQAFQILVNHSQRENTKVHNLASRIVARVVGRQA